MDKEICIRTGKTACSCITEILNKCIGSAGFAARKMSAGIGGMFKRISADDQIAACDEKQKEMYGQLGQQIFRGIKEKNENLLEQEKIKELVTQLSESERNVQKIEEVIAQRKRKMDEIVIFKQAKNNLQSNDPGMRRVAIRVFGRLGDKRAIPLLTRALEDPDDNVRECASQILHGFVDIVKESSG
jgi:HEAT repeat protein